MPGDLEGVVATSTRLSHVEGEAGRLTIAGYAVEDLAPQARFEEVAYLLLHGRLPESSELVRFTQDLAGRRALPRAGLDVLREAAAAQVPPMDMLRMATALLSLGRQENPVDDALTAIASFPTIVGAYWRMRSGAAPVAVRPDLPHAAHYLHQLSGAEPAAERAGARRGGDPRQGRSGAGPHGVRASHLPGAGPACGCAGPGGAAFLCERRRPGPV